MIYRIILIVIIIAILAAILLWPQLNPKIGYATSIEINNTADIIYAQDQKEQAAKQATELKEEEPTYPDFTMDEIHNLASSSDISYQ